MKTAINTLRRIVCEILLELSIMSCPGFAKELRNKVTNLKKSLYDRDK